MIEFWHGKPYIINHGTVVGEWERIEGTFPFQLQNETILKWEDDHVQYMHTRSLGLCVEPASSSCGQPIMKQSLHPLSDWLVE